jgi:competence protein ComEA
MDPMRKRLVLIIILVILIFAGSFYSYWLKNSVTETASSSLTPIVQVAASESNDVVIYVNGAVNQPGVFKIKNGSRIIDAINQAGGLAPGADCSNLNLAQEVKDGMQIQVATNVITRQGDSNSGNKDSGKININTADKNALDKLPGIGPALAERIVEYRKNNGPFRDVSDLKKVSGIGEAKFKNIKDRISL